MSDPIISQPIVEYRPLTLTPQGWLGFPEKGWSLQPDSGPRPVGGVGSFKPDASNTGITSSRSRTVYAGSLDLGTPNKVFRNVDFYGNVRCLATGLKFYNCGFYGGTSWPKEDNALVDCSYGVEGNTTTLQPWKDIPYFEECTFKAQRPTYHTDGIRGAYWLNRCNLSRLRHGCLIETTSETRLAHVRIESSYIHNLVYWYKVPDGSDGLIYGVNIKSPGFIYIGGNFIEGSVVLGNDRNFNDPDGVGYPGGSVSERYPVYVDHMPHVPGAGLRAVTDRAFSTDLVIEKNWFDKGLVGAELGPGNYTFQNNTFQKDGFYLRRANGSRHHIRLDSLAVIEGLSTNRYNTGEPMTTTNGGITY